MKFKIKTFLPFILLINPFNLYSQITITEIEKTEERIVLKPAPYDSLSNWQQHEILSDYKKYIGLQIYIPPFKNPEIGSKEGRTFLYNLKPSIITIDSTNEALKLKYSWRNYYDKNSYYIESSIEYPFVYTWVYKPYHNKSVNGERESNKEPYVILSNSSEVGNKYYTILDVLYSSKLKNLCQSVGNDLDSKKINKDNQNIKNNIVYDRNYMDCYRTNGVVLLLKDEQSGDSILCEDYNRNAILVPFFIKQKNLFFGKNLIYENSKIEEFDPRFIVRSEDVNGNEKITGKTVIIEPGSKWICSDVTLLKPSYEIYYILNNDKNEQVALKWMKGFITESDYAKRESDKKLQNQQLLAKQKQDKLQRDEKEKKAFEKRKAECISLFGLQNGELIAQGKVQINMTKEMCHYAWGLPLWTHKKTTEYGTYEACYYSYGYSLHFENGLLKKIVE